jgi:ABC-type sugar transport system ATPase subunit
MTSLSSSLDPDATQSAPEFIEMRGISKRFGGVRALQDVSFSILAAEIHSLAGENGCGKSTLIKVLSGVHAPDEGEIVLEGKCIRIFRPLPPSVSASRSFTRICRCFQT